jgi:hypothetical protein
MSNRIVLKDEKYKEEIEFARCDGGVLCVGNFWFSWSEAKKLKKWFNQNIKENERQSALRGKTYPAKKASK